MTSDSNGKIHLDLDPDIYGDGYKDPFIQDEDKLSITELIPRILIERQSFLNITEESLQKEIDDSEMETIEEESKSPESETVEEDLNEDEIIGNKVTFESFQKQIMELSKNINIALNETSLSLDFVSLLISAVKPNIGKSTISPHLSKNVPLGSLNADRLSIEEDDESTASNKFKNSAAIGQGWKLESINKITTLFRHSSIKLNEQVLKERRYWNMINLVLNNDEVLFKLRDPLNGSKSIGVKYGYGDSGSCYYDKGLAVLRKNDPNGEISFIPISSSSNKFAQKVYKYLRIKILSKIDDDYMLTGQSIFDEKFDTSKYKIINDIEKARFFLFEEDLFYQLIREAKTLINYNVSIISNKIIIEVNDEIIEIESIIYDENNDDDLNNYYQNINNYSSINNSKAQLILSYSKLMLCCYYNYNLKLKQKIPTSLTKWKQSNSHPLILRPLLGNIRHEINLKTMNNILNEIFNEFKDKLDAKLSLNKFNNLNNKSGNPFQKSIEKPISKFDLTLKCLKTNNYLKIVVEMTTNEIFVNLIINLNIIKFENSDDLNKNLNGLNVLQINFNDFNDIEECLKWTILNFIKE